MFEKPLVADRYRPLVPVALAAAGGIVADRFFVGPAGSMTLWWFFAAVCLAGHLALAARGADRAAGFMLLLAVGGLFASWHHKQLGYAGGNELARFAGTTADAACVEATVHGPVRWSPSPPRDPMRALPSGPTTSAVLEVHRIRDGEHWLDTSGRLRLRVNGHLVDVHAGDQVRVIGRLSRPEGPRNPGGFDWARLALSRGYRAEMYSSVTELVSVEPRRSPPLAGWAGTLNRRCTASLIRFIGPERADLAAAMLLGSRERIDPDTFESFLHTGTVHLLVVSGLHVGVLALFVHMLLKTVTSRTRVIAVTMLLFVFGYAAVTGMRPPVLRAATLITALVVASSTGRRVSALNALSLAALAILVISPMELFQSGTQLSFASVAAIAALARINERRPEADKLVQMIRAYEPPWRSVARGATTWFAGMTLASLTVWLVAMPLVAHHFHIVSFTGVLLTPVLWVLVCGELAMSMAVCAVGWFLPPLGHLLGAACGVCLDVISAVVALGESTGGYAYTPGPPAWWVVGWYIGLAGLCFVPNLLRLWRWPVAVVLLWVAAGIFAAEPNTDDDHLRCTFLAVGHGTCVVLETPTGQVLLYDAGSLNSPEGSTQAVSGFLWSRGHRHIDAVVLSHADVDHYNAVPGLLERFSVGTVFVSPLMFDPLATGGQMTAPNRLRAALDRRGIPMREVWMNDRLALDDPRVTVEVLHPPRRGVAGRDNANSVLLAVTFQGRTVLLPGDLEASGIDAVTAEPPLDCDVLLAPHHGSLGSDPPGFAAWSTPEWVVISGRDPASADTLEQVNRAYRASGARLLHTAESGAVCFSVGADGVTARTHLVGEAAAETP